MYVTALCAVIEPGANEATIACAGHKIPLVRYSAAASNLLTLQPEGIALGFDKGAIFDKNLEIQRVPIEPGDRLVLANTGPVLVENPDGTEFGEKAFFKGVLRAGKDSPEEIIDSLEAMFEAHADEEPFPADISIVVIARD